MLNCSPLEVDVQSFVEDQANQPFFANRAYTGEAKLISIQLLTNTIWSEKRYLYTLRNPTHGGRQEVHFGRGVAQGD